MKIDTQSDPHSPSTPSTEKQKDLGRALVEEMTRMGMERVRMDDTGYVYGEIPANVEGKPVILSLIHISSRPKSRPWGRLALKRFAAARSHDVDFLRLRL